MPGNAGQGGWRTFAERVAAAEDALHISAPATGRIQIAFLAITTETAGTTFLVRLEDGAGGTQIASYVATVGESLVLNPGVEAPIELTDQTGLNRETTGTPGAINIVSVYRVKG